MQTSHTMLAQRIAHLTSVLTEEQKVRLLTDIDSLADPAFNANGVPRVALARVAHEALPTPAALARSWDPALMAEATRVMTRSVLAGGVEGVILPGAKVAPAGALGDNEARFDAMAEDPHLVGVLAGAILRGAGDMPVLTEDDGLAPSDAVWVDHPPEDRVVELFQKQPMEAALAAGRPVGVVIDGNASFMEGRSEFVLRRQTGERETVCALARGELCMKGSASALQAALHTHRRLRAALEAGKATMGELNAAEAVGDALSEETLNAALGRLIAFAMACNEGVVTAGLAVRTSSATQEASVVTEASAQAEAEASPAAVPADEAPVTRTEGAEGRPVETQPEHAAASVAQAGDGGRPVETRENEERAAPVIDATLMERALTGATVLLDNRRGLLPLATPKAKKPSRVALIGALAAEDIAEMRGILTAGGHTVAGYEPGMVNDADVRRDDLITQAVGLSQSADVTVLCLTSRGARRSRAEAARGALPRLPACARALCDRVCGAGKPVVLVLGEAMVDPTFLSFQALMPAAILMVPEGVPGRGRHIAELLVGRRAPAGRLTATIPTGEADKARRGLRRGPFVGYRYYESVGFGTAYPFGHGMTYTRFRYSHLTVEPGRVRFVVRNSGGRAGVAIPQVYVGAVDGSERASELSELAGDITAPIKAVLVRLGRRKPEAEPSPWVVPKRELAAYTCISLEPGETRTVTLEWKPVTVAGGRESVYVGSRTYTVSVGESAADIRLSGRVTLPGGMLPAGGELSQYLPTVPNTEQEYDTLEALHTPMKSSLRNLLFGLAALVLAVSVKIYNIVSVSDAVFLDILAFILAGGATVFFALEWVERRRRMARQQAAIEAELGELYAHADTIPAPSADALFAEAEALSEEDDTAESAAGAVEAGRAYDYMQDVDKELTLPVAVHELCTLAAERGVSLDGETARSILSSFLASRLIVVKDMADEAFEALLGLLCEYFGCPVAADRVDAGYDGEGAVLYGATAPAGRAAVTDKESTPTSTEAAVPKPENADAVMAVAENIATEEKSGEAEASAETAASPQAEVKVEAKAEAEVKAEAKAEAEVKTEDKTEVKTEDKAEDKAQAEPAIEPKTESKAEPTIEPEAEPVVAPEVEAEIEVEAPVDFGGRQALRALEAAERDIRRVHVAALSDVKWSTLSAYFVPYVRYARAPHSGVTIQVTDAEGMAESYRIPENLWFVLRLGEGEILADMPAYVAEVATVHTWSVGTGAPAVSEDGGRASHRLFTYGQAQYLADRARAGFALDEEIWKRFDRLEAYVARHGDFSIGNKQWLGLESYLAALMEAGYDRAAALDEALAATVLPSVIPALHGKLSREERGLGETLDVLFGDGETTRCRRMLKRAGAELI